MFLSAVSGCEVQLQNTILNNALCSINQFNRVYRYKKSKKSQQGKTKQLHLCDYFLLLIIFWGPVLVLVPWESV